MAGTADDANRESVLLAEREGPVSAGEGLVVYLLTGALISSSVAGVDQDVPVIDVVLVPAGEDYGVCALGLASRDARPDREVHPTLAQLGAVLEEAPLGIPWHVSEDPPAHAEP